MREPAPRRGRSGGQARAVEPAAVERARAAVATVTDPEMPMVTIEDLGVLRGVEQAADGHVVVTITPTYSGCPAMEVIRSDVAARLQAAGLPDAEVRTVLAPAWTTDWLSDAARRKLAESGIAPPPPAVGSAATGGADGGPAPVAVELGVRCPRCGVRDTRLVSRFGPTACTAIRACRACGEPFEHFKAI
ncbi:MAG: 1,2-phenylacetyl-CoA epoxidase subunit PaaD [Acidimicrobiales bacterium]